MHNDENGMMVFVCQGKYLLHLLQNDHMVDIKIHIWEFIESRTVRLSQMQCDNARRPMHLS